MGAGVKAHVVADVHRALVQDDDASGGLRGIGNLVLSQVWDFTEAKTPVFSQLLGFLAVSGRLARLGWASQRLPGQRSIFDA